jgi:hypothetical protein
MANTMPPESYPVATRVPNRASNSGTTPLKKPIVVGNMQSPAATRPATPIVSVPDPGRERPSNVSQPSGRDSGYPRRNQSAGASSGWHATARAVSRNAVVTLVFWEGYPVSQSCSVCRLVNRSDIEKMLVDGVPHRRIAASPNKAEHP